MGGSVSLSTNGSCQHYPHRAVKRIRGHLHVQGLCLAHGQISVNESYYYCHCHIIGANFYKKSSPLNRNV